MDLKLNDVRLRGCGYTLFPAATEAGFNAEAVHALLIVAYRKVHALSEDYEEQIKVEAKNPDFPDTFLVSEFESFQTELEELINCKLVSKDGDTVVLNPSAMELFKRAAELQIELDNSDFFFCPCMRCH